MSIHENDDREKALLAWIGTTDLKAAAELGGPGPIARALDKMKFRYIWLFDDGNCLREGTNGESYEKWLQERCAKKWPTPQIFRKAFDIQYPTNLPAIYKSAVQTLDTEVKQHLGNIPKRVFLTSSGTPTMCAVWIILATKYRAMLIETQEKEPQCREVHIPGQIWTTFRSPETAELQEQAFASMEEMRALAPQIVFQCEEMKKVVERALRTAPFEAPVLLLGESGVGKELLAEVIHKNSRRAANKFLSVNCASIPENLIESELFGHVKGAFTGAEREKDGLFQACDQGTLFLDEIGEMPLKQQARLLRAVQDGEVRKMGSNTTETCNVRIVAATNRDLITEVAKGNFREDLFYRIAMVPITLPPLRNRGKREIELLARKIIDKINTQNSEAAGFPKSISNDAIKVLTDYHWPGNHRELYNVLLRSAIFSEGQEISAEDARRELEMAMARPDRNTDDYKFEDMTLKMAKRELEKKMIAEALRKNGDNKKKAAESLGISRQALDKIISKDST